MAETITEIQQSLDTIILKPSNYKVIIYNDEHTPFDFVISLLINLFRHNEVTAIELANTVHNAGSGVAGIYSYEVAEQKAMEGTDISRKNGYPLLLKVEKE